ncbi:ATP-binding protein [Jiella sp. MQZ9-1]|uniref:histidine kinase n=1 Tax=Jiella flava TaxID=2816857 RepID=A0A939JVT5_9HYPH|nr:sensor histidine kinase [Jiella flava]MBO0661596.1 CHASE3 domain-containing protein [Jiella flava]MCD2470239.1 ATP-binding protein [Jiella flava]
MNTAQRQFNRAIFAAIATGFFMLIIAAGAVVWAFQRTQDIGQRVTHSIEIEAAIANLNRLDERIEAARRGFLLEGDKRFLRTFEVTAAEIPHKINDMAKLTADNPDQIRRVEQYRKLAKNYLDLVEKSIANKRAGITTVPGSSLLDKADIAVSQQLRDLSDTMSSAERDLLEKRTTREHAGILLSTSIGIVAATILLLVSFGTIWVVRRTLAALSVAGEQLRLLNGDLESAVAERTAELQRANAEIQRFAYIVSHDLRSPLVNVMGFTSELAAAIEPLSELLEMAEERIPDSVTDEARYAVRENLPESVGFIRTSTEKMDRLINAILRLSREGRRMLAPEAVDMNALVTSIIDSLQHRVGELGVTMKAEPLPTVITDKLAIEQILSNLIENAIKYLKADRPGTIIIRGQKENSRVLIEVEDNGRGIDPKDHERIFDLFRRSGTQDQPGEGIGLAHVRALAHRLGGTISCTSALENGATFRLSLPKDLAPQQGSNT